MALHSQLYVKRSCHTSEKQIEFVRPQIGES